MESVPCSDYRVDMTAATFGSCMCGHPKQAHISKGENKATAALGTLKKRTSGVTSSDVTSPDGKQSKPCSDYVLDPTGVVFGQCRCGHPKDAHIVAEAVNPAEAALARLSARSKTSEALSSPAPEPCSKFIADTRSAEFGMCICGHKRDAHNVKEVNQAELARLAMKEKNAQKEAAKQQAEEATRVEAELKAKAEKDAEEAARVEAGQKAKAEKDAEDAARVDAEQKAKAEKEAEEAKARPNNAKEVTCCAGCSVQ